MRTTRSAVRADRSHVARDEDPKTPRFASSHGSIVVDEHGKEHIDFFMGWCVGNLGWGVKEISDRMRRFEGPTYVPPQFEYTPWGELALRLARITPGDLQTCYRATGGTEAVDLALQLAMIATGRHKFVSIEGSYHGNSIGALSVGASSSRETLKLLPSCQKVDKALDVGPIETLLKKREVAAFIMEPVAMNLGVLVPQRETMREIRRLCRKYGTLFIADEVACGFGRTGKMFASEHFDDLSPDIMCLAKAITGGHAPMGAMIATDEVAARAKGFSAWSTYGWHPLSVEAALATLDYFEAHHETIFANVAARSAQLTQGLRAIFGSAADIRALGMAIALEVESAEAIVERANRKGLLLGGDEGRIEIFPALDLDRETAERGLDILEQCVRKDHRRAA
jgi:acetylornithine/succinyldiaminopimelate/putrescine aminotransferase